MKRWLCDLWCSLLVLIHLRPDPMDPDYCYPSLDPYGAPHPFSRFEGALVCGKCGGGRLHKIHQVKG